MNKMLVRYCFFNAFHDHEQLAQLWNQHNLDIKQNRKICFRFLVPSFQFIVSKCPVYNSASIYAGLNFVIMLETGDNNDPPPVHPQEQQRGGVEVIVGGTKDQSSLLQQSATCRKNTKQEIEIRGKINPRPTRSWDERNNFHIIENYNKRKNVKMCS